jgi:hypothetical protein
VTKTPVSIEGIYRLLARSVILEFMIILREAYMESSGKMEKKEDLFARPVTRPTKSRSLVQLDSACKFLRNVVDAMGLEPLLIRTHFTGRQPL